MLLDNENLFCENQEITSGTLYSQNIINFGKNDVSFAPVLVQAVSDFSGLTSLSVSFETSQDASFSEPVELAKSTLYLSQLKSGSTFPITFLPKGNKGFMRLKFVVEGSETTGKITSGVVAGNGISHHEM
ncbi:MAG: hypothetical protein IJB79_03515 [Candidatus Gastranaerophilales bacterium]|nr:hypothetical protein [Candidatus Gastranaerophilales bacterium]